MKTYKYKVQGVEYEVEIAEVLPWKHLLQLRP